LYSAAWILTLTIINKQAPRAGLCAIVTDQILAGEKLFFAMIFVWSAGG
jgi:hypothetical protein